MTGDKDITIEKFLNFFDFGLEKCDDGYRVVDFQGADLGNIENERFQSIKEIIERFDGSIYIPDYIEDDIEERAGKSFDTYSEMYEWCRANGDEYHGDILYALINPDSVTE